MIQRKIQLHWKNVSLFFFALIGFSWLGYALWSLLQSVPHDPWKQATPVSARQRAEKEGKSILFLIEPQACIDCIEIRKALEGFADIQSSYVLDAIQEGSDPSRYEAVLIDDRYSDEIRALSDRRGLWGVTNGSDEILFLKTGVPGLEEESILLKLAEKNRFPSKGAEIEPE
ncbi:hypothetical protein LFX25_18515 [Leptospira sp. FAT2]|uniref:hypothetical protein n=1 Tax=Leptospira sanjuanensis TaxID=2879643 RepID=UPI001EE96746|nr:hypothetical protein [Leptospira sanjuanensis]MCG6195236.1 hypothetical protein [Leptospira sanjuanensis]